MGVLRRELPTGTVTFLFSDIEGSTRLVQAVGPEVYRVALEHHNTILRDAFAGHGGVERGTQGDSFTVIFRETPAAVAGAVAAQRGIAAARWTDGVAVRVRIGLHTGVGLAGGDDYVGVDINRAARIAAAAYGGQTLISEATHALVARDLPAGTYVRDRGRHRLRDLAEPEHLFEVAVDGLTPDFGPPPTATMAGNLPDRLTSFIGREAELAELGALLGDTRLLTITGPGGIGKTSVAIELARRAAPGFPDGAWLVRLESVVDPDLLAPTIVDALGIPDVGGRGHLDRLLDHLAGRQVLMVLDNLEQLDRAGAVVVKLLEAVPGLRVVATSRAPLHIAAEQVYPLAPLPVGSTDGRTTEDATRLFIDRARRIQPRFDPTDVDAEAVAEICRRVDGLPLGIELAAARIRLLPPRAILDRLEQRPDLPGPTAVDAPARQRTLNDTIAWSHDLLDPPARRLLARLAVFSGGSRLEEAERVAGDAVALGIDVLEGLATLVDQSLVTPAAGVDGPRYRMFETIRSFAADRLAESGEAPAIRRRHALAYLQLAQAEAPHIPGRDQAVRLARLAGDHDNLRAAIGWAIETGDADIGLAFAPAMWRFWQAHGHLDEGDRFIRAILAIPGATRDDPLRMRAMDAAGGIAYWRGDHERARSLYAEQLRIARALGDRPGEADGLFNLGHVIVEAVTPGSADSLLDQAATLYRELGDERGVARTDWVRAQRPVFLGKEVDFGNAIEQLRDGLRRFEELDDYMYAQISCGSLAWAHLAMGHLPEAVRWGTRSLLMSWESGDVAGATFDLQAVAIVMAALGRLEEASVLQGAFEELRGRWAIEPPLVLGLILEGVDTAGLTRERLDPAVHDAAIATGRAFTLDEAVDFALRAIATLADHIDAQS